MREQAGRTTTGRNNKHTMKKTLITITRDTLGPIVTAYACDRAALLATRSQTDARIAALRSQIDAEEAAWQAAHADEERRLDVVMESVERFVARNGSTLFAPGERHIDFAGVRVGVRATPWSVAKNERTETWEEVAAGMLEHRTLAGYVRTKHSVDKEALLRDRETVDAVALSAHGLRYAQDDVVYIES